MNLEKLSGEIMEARNGIIDILYTVKEGQSAVMISKEAYRLSGDVIDQLNEAILSLNAAAFDVYEIIEEMKEVGGNDAKNG